MEGSGLRWRGAITGGGERSPVELSDQEGSDRVWRGAVSVGGVERSLVEVRWRGAITG